MRCGDQFLQNAALSGRMVGVAASAQDFKLLLERAHGFQSGLNPFELFFNDGVDIFAVLSRSHSEIDQQAYLCEWHI